MVWYVSHGQSLTTRVNFFPTFRVLSVVALLVAEKYIPIVMHKFIRGQRLYKFMHFLLICLINNNNNIYIFISFNTVYVIPVYAVLFISMMPLGDMSMFYVMKVAGDKVFAFKTHFHEVF